jgi:hypothetical protein
MINFDPVARTSSYLLNGTTIGTATNQWNETGGAIHLGGGGDLSQPGPAVLREMIVSNSVFSPTTEAAVRANMTAFYTGLTFPAVVAGSTCNPPVALNFGRDRPGSAAPPSPILLPVAKRAPKHALSEAKTTHLVTGAEPRGVGGYVG